MTKWGIVILKAWKLTVCTSNKEDRKNELLLRITYWTDKCFSFVSPWILPFPAFKWFFCWNFRKHIFYSYCDSWLSQLKNSYILFTYLHIYILKIQNNSLEHPLVLEISLLNCPIQNVFAHKFTFSHVIFPSVQL